MAHVRWLGTNKKYSGSRCLDGTPVTMEDVIMVGDNGSEFRTRMVSPQFETHWHDHPLYGYMTVEKRKEYKK